MRTLAPLRPHEGLICRVARGLRSAGALSGDDIDALVHGSCVVRAKSPRQIAAAFVFAKRRLPLTPSLWSLDPPLQYSWPDFKASAVFIQLSGISGV